MAPWLLLLLGICLLPFWLDGSFVYGLVGILGVVSIVVGIKMGYGVYSEGNRIYWQWYRADQSWRVACEKRHTILDELANRLAHYGPQEAALLRDLSADRSGAAFMMQTFPELYTIGQTGTLYFALVNIEDEINALRQQVLGWAASLQEMGTNGYINMALPAFVRHRLTPALRRPYSDLMPDAESDYARPEERSTAEAAFRDQLRRVVGPKGVISPRSLERLTRRCQQLGIPWHRAQAIYDEVCDEMAAV
jgi:hypothetical protein